MDNISRLIERYFSGSCSLEEEELLKKYVLSESIAEEHKYLQPLFGFYDNERNRKMPKTKVTKAKVLSLKVVRRISYTVAAASVALVLVLNYAPNSKGDYAIIKGHKIENEKYAQNLAVSKLNKVNNILEKRLRSVEKLNTIQQKMNEVRLDNEKIMEIIKTEK